MVAGLCKRLLKSQYLVYLSFDGPIIMLKLTFDNVMEEILNVSRLAYPVHSVWPLSLFESLGDIRAVMNLFIDSVIKNPIKPNCFKA